MYSQDPNPTLAPVLIPLDLIAEDTLCALIEDFITRDGTEYSQDETEISIKKDQVLKQLKRGLAGIIFFPGDESFTLLTRDEILKRGLT